MNDFSVENHGSIFLIRPLTKAAALWLQATAPEDAQFFGPALAVEPRYVDNVLVHLEEAGFRF